MAYDFKVNFFHYYFISIHATCQQINAVFVGISIGLSSPLFYKSECAQGRNIDSNEFPFILKNLQKHSNKLLPLYHLGVNLSSLCHSTFTKIG